MTCSNASDARIVWVCNPTLASLQSLVSSSELDTARWACKDLLYLSLQHVTHSRPLESLSFPPNQSYLSWMDACWPATTLRPEQRCAGTMRVVHWQQGTQQPPGLLKACCQSQAAYWAPLSSQDPHGIHAPPVQGGCPSGTSCLPWGVLHMAAWGLRALACASVRRLLPMARPS